MAEDASVCWDGTRSGGNIGGLGGWVFDPSCMAKLMTDNGRHRFNELSKEASQTPHGLGTVFSLLTISAALGALFLMLGWFVLFRI